MNIKRFSTYLNKLLVIICLLLATTFNFPSSSHAIDLATTKTLVEMGIDLFKECKDIQDFFRKLRYGDQEVTKEDLEKLFAEMIEVVVEMEEIETFAQYKNYTKSIEDMTNSDNWSLIEATYYTGNEIICELTDRARIALGNSASHKANAKICYNLAKYYNVLVTTQYLLAQKIWKDKGAQNVHLATVNKYANEFNRMMLGRSEVYDSDDPDRFKYSYVSDILTGVIWRYHELYGFSPALTKWHSVNGDPVYRYLNSTYRDIYEASKAWELLEKNMCKKFRTIESYESYNYKIYVPRRASRLVFRVKCGNTEPTSKYGYGFIQVRDDRNIDYKDSMIHEGGYTVVEFKVPQRRFYHVYILIFKANTDVHLCTDYQGGKLDINENIYSLKADKDEWIKYVCVFPKKRLDFHHYYFEISRGTGDADLYVRRRSSPTVDDYDCRPHKLGNNEKCGWDIKHNGPTIYPFGYFYVYIRGYKSFDGVRLIQKLY